MVIRHATSDDAAALAALAERTFRDAFAAQNTAADMDDYCRESFSLEMQRALLGDKSIDTLLIVDERGELVAYAQLRPGAAEGLTLEAPLELWRFYVDQVHHGRGLAQRLMIAVDAAAHARGASTLWLGVWEHNQRAQAFYRKCGFVDVGSHQFALGRDVQTDQLMAREVRKAQGDQGPPRSP